MYFVSRKDFKQKNGFIDGINLIFKKGIRWKFTKTRQNTNNINFIKLIILPTLRTTDEENIVHS